MTFAGLLIALTAAAPQPADLALWRLDCGTLDVSDFRDFSDTGRYDGQRRAMVDSCYLVRHGDDYLLWDAGLSGAIADKPVTSGVFTLRLKERLVPQLARIGVKPEQVRYLGISHYHFDHTGQAADFPAATLLIGAEDLAAVKAGKTASTEALKPWAEGSSKAEVVEGDKDVFGDGSVVMLNLPGHTPGHHALLVRLKETGPVLLSGDQFHAQESYDHDQVPVFNTDRADTLASIARFKEMAGNLEARVIIQHEPADVAKLPAFPQAAR